jgi:hypothetical protein
MRLNDKQTLLSIKALSHYINNALQCVANDDEEKQHTKYLLRTMEDALVNAEKVSEQKDPRWKIYFDEIETQKPFVVDACTRLVEKVKSMHKSVSLWKLVPMSIETRVIFSTLAEREDIVRVKFETDGKIVFASLVAIEDCVCAAHDIDDVIKIVRCGNNLQFEQRTHDGHVWHEFELLDHQLYSLLENNVIYNITLN